MPPVIPTNKQTIINEIKAFSLKPAIRINKINIPSEILKNYELGFRAVRFYEKACKAWSETAEISKKYYLQSYC